MLKKLEPAGPPNFYVIFVNLASNLLQMLIWNNRQRQMRVQEIWVQEKRDCVQEMRGEKWEKKGHSVQVQGEKVQDQKEYCAQ